MAAAGQWRRVIGCGVQNFVEGASPTGVNASEAFAPNASVEVYPFKSGVFGEASIQHGCRCTRADGRSVDECARLVSLVDAIAGTLAKLDAIA